jgi:hypothetical protein
MKKANDITMAKFIAARNEEDLRSILNVSWGQRFISQLLYDCGIYNTGADFNNINVTYFNAGMRSIGNALLARVLAINPDAYKAMKKQDKEDQDARELEAEQRNKSLEEAGR